MFNVVLHQPEIPNNTGNIGRTCVATGCTLHLIHPLGFSTSEKACRRAGLDYWARLAPVEHPSWEEFLTRTRPAPLWLFTTKKGRPVWDVPIAPGDWLVFGSETRGLPDSILAAHPGRLVTLPMREGERSLNLATVVCTGVYEGVRQAVSRGDAAVDGDVRLRPRVRPEGKGA